MSEAVENNHEIFKDCLGSAVLEKYISTESPRKMAKRYRKGSRGAGSPAGAQHNVPQGGESDPAELAEFIEVTASLSSLEHFY
jgi:cyanophycinase-like exopeptidase